MLKNERLDKRMWKLKRENSVLLRLTEVYYLIFSGCHKIHDHTWELMAEKLLCACNCSGIHTSSRESNSE